MDKHTQTHSHAHIMGLELKGKRWGQMREKGMRVGERGSIHERAHMLTHCPLMHMEWKKSWSIYCSSRIDESVCTHSVSTLHLKSNVRFQEPLFQNKRYVSPTTLYELSIQYHNIRMFNICKWKRNAHTKH